jgi:hypothetical protein
VGTASVVIPPPAFDLHPCIPRAEEPVEGQALVPEAAQDALHEAVLRGPTWLDVLDPYVLGTGPGVGGATPELRAIITEDALRRPAGVPMPLEDVMTCTPGMQ